MRISLKRIIVPGIPLAVLLVGICLALWLSSYAGQLPHTLPAGYSDIVENIFMMLAPGSLLSNLVSIALTLLNAFLLAHLNNRHSIIRARTFLPLVIFLLLMSTWSETHVVNGSHIALTLFILALFNFFGMGKDRHASEQAFAGSFLIGIASLLINPFVLLIPVCWIGLIIFQSFSLRTFLATIIGVLTPWVLYLAALYITNIHIDFQQLLVNAFTLDLSLLELTLPRIIYGAALVIMLAISLVGMYSISHNDAIQTRNKLNFLLLLLISIMFISLAFKNQFISFLPVIALLYAILMSHPLTLKQNNFYGILFLVFVFVNIAYMVSKYFII